VRLRGFTLVEILTVIVLVGILIIFSLIYVPAQLAKARDGIRKGDIDRIDNAIEEYSVDAGCYPLSIPQCGYPLSLGDKTYIPSLPCDPDSKNSYVYVSEISSCPSWFQIYGNVEFTKEAIIDRLDCRSGCGPRCQFNYGSSSTNQKLNPFCDTDEEVEPQPTVTPTPTVENLQYVCAPGGACTAFLDPIISGCPDIYLDDPTCQDQCSLPKNRCHDARGKVN
jgi:prepilin-type N-terminal cleavage/methylation domain-containing protein